MNLPVGFPAWTTKLLPTTQTFVLQSDSPPRLRIKVLWDFANCFIFRGCHCHIVAVSGLSFTFSHEWFAMDQVVGNSNCCVGREPGIFDHRPGEIRCAFGRANRRADRVAATWPTFKSDAGTISESNSHSFVCPKGNTRGYSDPYAVTNSLRCTSASPASTPPPIDAASARGSLLRVRQARWRFRDYWPLGAQVCSPQVERSPFGFVLPALSVAPFGYQSLFLLLYLAVLFEKFVE